MYRTVDDCIVLKTLIMDFLLMLLTASLLNSLTWGSPVCDNKWEVDWNQQSKDFSWDQIFAQPGELAPGVSSRDLLNFTGTLWNINSFQKISGLVCVRYGPYLSTMLEDDELRDVCDRILASLREEKRSDILGGCNDVWDMLGIDNLTNNFIESNDTFLSNNLDQTFLNISGISCDMDPFLTIYADKIVERISPVLFELLRWLGPSPFSGDVFGACSAMRILLSEDIDNTVDEIKNILSFPAADVLEYFAHIDACEDLDDETKQILTTISWLSDPDQLDICSFLSSGPSRAGYLQRANDIIDGILSVPVEKSLCEDLLTAFLAYDMELEGMSYILTGSNLTVQSGRQMFCDQIAYSLSEDSQYIPIVYSLPDGQELNLESLLNRPGEILPGFPFMDMVNVVGAFFRSKSLSQGITVLCTVFKNTLVQLDDNINNLCDSLESGDLASSERMCLTLIVPLQYVDHPISLRIPTLAYMIVTGVDMARRLFDLDKISKEDLCLAVDDFYHSGNSPHSVVQFGLRSFLAELLPIADNICRDYDNVINYIASKSNQSSTSFDQLSDDLSDLILTHMGFSNKEELCSVIAAGIDQDSGRAENELIVEMAEEFLLFMTDSTRCSRVMGKTESVLTLHYGDISEMMHSVTGYKNLATMCDAMNTAFKPGEICGNTQSIGFRQCYSLGLLVVVVMAYSALLD